jgi:hypothetical protein
MHRQASLDTLIGTWRTTGRLASGEPLDFEGTDSYEWFPGGSFLLHHVDVTMGGDAVKAIEIISYDEATGKYPMHHFDGSGKLQVSEGRFNGNGWTFSSFTERGSFTFSEDGNVLSGTWEKLSEKKVWEPWLHVQLKKQP